MRWVAAFVLFALGCDGDVQIPEGYAPIFRIQADDEELLQSAQLPRLALEIDAVGSATSVTLSSDAPLGFRHPASMPRDGGGESLVLPVSTFIADAGTSIPLTVADWSTAKRVRVTATIGTVTRERFFDLRNDDEALSITVHDGTAEVGEMETIERSSTATVTVSYAATGEAPVAAALRCFGVAACSPADAAEALTLRPGQSATRALTFTGVGLARILVTAPGQRDVERTVRVDAPDAPDVEALPAVARALSGLEVEHEVTFCSDRGGDAMVSFDGASTISAPFIAAADGACAGRSILRTSFTGDRESVGAVVTLASASSFHMIELEQVTRLDVRVESDTGWIAADEAETRQIRLGLRAETDSLELRALGAVSVVLVTPVGVSASHAEMTTGAGRLVVTFARSGSQTGDVSVLVGRFEETFAL